MTCPTKRALVQDQPQKPRGWALTDKGIEPVGIGWLGEDLPLLDSEAPRPIPKHHVDTAAQQHVEHASERPATEKRYRA